MVWSFYFVQVYYITFKGVGQLHILICELMSFPYEVYLSVSLFDSGPIPCTKMQ